jgi:hypothetical protein
MVILEVLQWLSTGLLTSAIGWLYVRPEIRYQGVLEENAEIQNQQVKLAHMVKSAVGRLDYSRRGQPPEASAVGAGCENFALAQLEGPTSAAASCECDYCVSMREARSRVKAALTPKSQAARIQAMRDGLSQP